MSIKCTVTTDLQVKDTNGYSGMQKHVEHDSSINHSNKDIVFDETQFNIYGESQKIRDDLTLWNQEHFQEYVDEHDQHQREKNHPERQYGSVKNYLSGKKKTTAILTIGNMEVQSELMKKFCPASSYSEEQLPDGSTHLVFKLKDNNGKPISDNITVAKKFYDCFNRALIAATNNNVGWNRNGKRINIGDYLHRGRYATNNDEMGISHIHFEVGTFGMTRGGKKRQAHPTNSLNQALVSLHQAVTGETVSGRVAIKWYRASIDNYALKCLENELHKTYNVPSKTQILNFERKTKDDPTVQTGLSMEQLKAQKAELADHQSKITQAQADQKKAEDDKQQAETNKKAAEAMAQQAYNALKNDYERVTGHKAVDSNNNPLSVQKLGEGLKSASESMRETVKQANEDKAIADQAVKALRASYKALTGKEAVDDHNQPLSPLECSRRIKKLTKKAQEDQTQAVSNQQAAEEAKQKALQEQQNAETARRTAQQQLDQLNQEIKTTKQKRRQAVTKELADNQLNYNNGEAVTEDNLEEVEKAIDNWRQEQRHQWQSEQTKNTQLVSTNQNLTTQNQQLKDENTNLQTTNSDLQSTNRKLITDNQTLTNEITEYKTQLIDTITENEPTHKVEQSRLQSGEVAEEVQTYTGRQQHQRQPLKYLINTVKKILQHLKQDTETFINDATRILQPQKPITANTKLESHYLDPDSIRPTKHPFNAQEEKRLMNNPAMKLKKAILQATQEQLQQAQQHIGHSIQKDTNGPDFN